MKFLKEVFSEIIKVALMATIALTVIKAYERFTYEEPSQILIDIYKRDNTVHLI